MKNKKASRLDRVEATLAKVIDLLGQQDQAVRWLVNEVKNIKDEDKPIEDPDQLKFDFGPGSGDSKL